MEVLAFSVFVTFRSITGTEGQLTEDQWKCYPLLKTGQEGQDNLLQFNI